MPMKSIARVAMNSALKADITEFSSKALRDTSAHVSGAAPA